jgi:DivIVA domain-containing protein
MTADATSSAPVANLTAEDVRHARFPETRGRSLGYDPGHVDAFLQRCATGVEQLTRRLQDQEQEIATLKRRIMEPDNQDRVLQSVDVLTKAQMTADSTVANANAYSGRVMAEARSLYDDARRRAAEMVEEAHLQATAAADAVASTHGELERQTAYLRTLRDVTRIQMEKFLGGLLDHVAAEYGKALPGAAEAAAQQSALSAVAPANDRTEVSAPSNRQALPA